jgi:hypothetical protein
MIVWANLDQEARWSGLGIPARVARRISAAASLLTVLAPPGETVEIFAPAAVDPRRLQLPHTPILRVGTPKRWDLAWADPGARGVNDRRFALAIAERLGCALPGARAIASLAELDAQLRSCSHPAWICKAAWTAAGRDRARGHGTAATGELRARIGKLIARAGAVVLEPWVDRLVDFGTCGRIDSPGHVVVERPHTLLVDVRGGFTGIAVRDPALEPDERAQLEATVHAVADALAAAGHTGPFGLDGFVYRDAAGGRVLHPFCEINARFTFGHVAHALGASELGFGLPPSGARILVAPSEDDPITAWVRG